MTTTTKTWDKKAIYHSEVVRASQGGLAVMFTGKPRDSKYPGKPAFVGFKVYGDESDYTLNIENDSVRQAIDGCPEKTWVTIRADGHRDMAWLAIQDANGNPVFGGVPREEIAPHQPAAPPAQDAPPANLWPEATGPYPPALDKPVVSATVGIAVDMTVAAVQGLERAGIRVDSDAAARIYNTHFIQCGR